MKQTHNLNTKKITEFTTEDTIYMMYPKDDRKPLFLCQFISYDKDKRAVTGKIIDTIDKRSYSQNFIGETIKTSLRNCALYGNATDEESRAYYRWFDASLYAMHPMEEHKVFENDVHVKKHPSYGLASFTRRSTSGGVSLFGSSIQNKETITLEIRRAEHERTYNNDWYSPREHLIEVEMSQTQFAELITTMNRGLGIPVTIKHTGLEIMPDPPFISKADIFHNEFTKQMHNFSVDMKKTVEQTMDILQNKSNINKSDREVIIGGINALMQHISGNIPFVQQQFQEAMETTVTEAKAEIEAFVENKIRNTGLEALGFNKEEQTPQIDYNPKN